MSFDGSTIEKRKKDYCDEIDKISGPLYTLLNSESVTEILTVILKFDPILWGGQAVTVRYKNKVLGQYYEEVSINPDSAPIQGILDQLQEKEIAPSHPLAEPIESDQGAGQNVIAFPFGGNSINEKHNMGKGEAEVQSVVHFPIMHLGKTIGAISIFSRKSVDEITSILATEKASTLKRLLKYAIVHIKYLSAHTTIRAQDRIEFDEVLASKIFGTSSLDALLELLVASVVDLVASPKIGNIFAYIFESSTHAWVCNKMRIETRDIQFEQLPLVLQAVGELEVKSVVAAEKIVAVKEYESCDSNVKRILETFHSDRMLFVRLKDRAVPIACLMMPIPNDDDINVKELENRLFGKMRLFIDQLRALHHAEQLLRRESKIREASTKYQALLDLVTKISTLRESKIIQRKITEEVIRIFGFDIGLYFSIKEQRIVLSYIGMLDTESQPKFKAIKRWGDMRKYSYEENDGFISQVHRSGDTAVYNGMPLIRHNLSSQNDSELVRIFDYIEEIVGVPIKNQSEKIGVLVLIASERKTHLNSEEQLMMGHLSELFGSSLFNAQIYEQVDAHYGQINMLNSELSKQITQAHALSSKDSLTEMYNNTFFHDETARRVEELRLKETKQQLSIAIFDIDEFKKYNNENGHEAGNQAIAMIAKQIQSIVRKMDIPARYSGQSFAVILPNCAVSGAEIFAERVRKSILTAASLDGLSAGRLTISAGVTEYREGEPIAQFIDRMHKALAEAKKAGKNRTAVNI